MVQVYYNFVTLKIVSFQIKQVYLVESDNFKTRSKILERRSTNRKKLKYESEMTRRWHCGRRVVGMRHGYLTASKRKQTAGLFKAVTSVSDFRSCPDSVEYPQEIPGAFRLQSWKNFITTKEYIF